jgi:poly-gamma-glutamate synthesis protein (capsule biosynthesis protein)
LSFEYQVANTVFNCRPEWVPEFSKFFTHANLANNHTADLGADVFEETRNHLEEGGVSVVGNYDPAVSEDVCDVMPMDVHVQMPDSSKQKGSLPIAMCAWHYFEREPQEGEIEVMKEYAEIMPVFGLMQVGVEYVPSNDPRQAAVGRAIIDNGAEFVIGNSPHWVQNTEVYKGKPIIYSTGNFIFDQLDAETNRGVSIAVSMEVPYSDNVAKWLELGESCKGRNDSCLAQAKEQGLTKPEASFTYEPIASVNGVHVITEKAPESIQQAVEERMNWQQTLQELGQQ